METDTHSPSLLCGGVVHGNRNDRISYYERSWLRSYVGMYGPLAITYTLHRKLREA